MLETDTGLLYLRDSAAYLVKVASELGALKTESDLIDKEVHSWYRRINNCK